MSNVYPLFKPVQDETKLSIVAVEEFTDVVPNNNYLDIQLHLDLLKRKVVELHSTQPTPTIVSELARSYEGLYTLLDLATNAVSGTLIPAYTVKTVSICTTEENPDIYGVQLSLADKLDPDPELTGPILNLTLLQVDIEHIDVNNLIGVVDDAWDDLTMSPEWDAPYYMANVIDNLMCMVMANSGYGLLSSTGKFVVNLPFHPSRAIQLVAQIH